MRGYIVMSLALGPLLVASPVCGDMLRVPSEYPTIQSGVDAAAPGDTVLVAPGTYTNCDLGPCLPSALRLKTGVHLVSEGGPAVTTIRVDTSGGGGAVVLAQGLDSVGAAIIGFTITGTAPGYRGLVLLSSGPILVEDVHIVGLAGGLTSGAGAFTIGVDVTFRECEFSGCVASGGAGLFTDAGSIVLERCLFAENAGGAVAITGYASRSLWVEECVFRENSGGGALSSFEMGDVVVKLNTFIGNDTHETPSALSVTSDDAKPAGKVLVADNVFIANSATGSVGATFALVSPGTVERNTFWGNFGQRASAILDARAAGELATIHANIFAGGTGGPAYRASFSEPTVSCNLFWENEGGDYFGHYIPSPTDLFTDPLFCDPATGDLTLQSGSPCLPEHSNGCGQIGALGQGCGTVSVDAWSWGRIKASYREGEDR